jgi:probable O-glycosylation ligase (exosortase A-associated)
MNTYSYQAVAAPGPRRGVGSPADLMSRAKDPRFAVLALLVFTFVWRFQELSGLLAPLKLTAFATLGAFLFLLAQPRASHLKLALRMSGLPLMIAFIVWMGIVIPFGLDPARSLTDWTGIHAKTIALMLFVAAFATSIDGVKRVMALHIIGASVLAAYYIKGGFPLWGTPVTTYDVNDLALHFNMCIPMILYFSVSSKRKLVRLALWALLGVFAVCVLMTQSRGGFLTLGVLGLVALVRMRGASVLVRAFPFVFLLIAYPLLPDATQARLKTLFSPKDDYNFESEEGRIEIWKRGLGYVAQHPVTGVGNSNFLVAERTISARAREDNFAGKVSHNSFVEVAAETGLPGFALYLAALVVAALSAFRLSNDLARMPGAGAKDAGAVASALGISVLCFFIGGFFLSMAHMQLLMTVIALVAGLQAVVLRGRDPALAAVSAGA